MTSPILWQSEQKDIFLVDIPGSIEAAQATNNGRRLQSTSPLEAPFPANEPKSASAKGKVESQDTDIAIHHEYQHILRSALDDIRISHTTAWCRPRPFTAEPTTGAKKRKLDGSASSSTLHPSVEGQVFSDAGELMQSLARPDTVKTPNVILTSRSDDKEVNEDITNTFSNTSERPVFLHSTCRDHGDNKEYIFLVPAGSSFYLGDCANAKPFRDAVRRQASQTDSDHRFDFIVLDPPWPNSSVKRTHRTPGSTYATSPSISDLRELLLDAKVDLLMADNGLVGIWITNRPAVRDLVLGIDGLFACWDVQLIEEWIWLKTTINGEPVTPVDAVWRKPYEVLLLGRKRRKAATMDDGSVEQPAPTRRVIVGVPDVHSRKPCLKELIESSKLIPECYRALEVFARYLVRGWWSWGDECIKFNCSDYWRAAE